MRAKDYAAIARTLYNDLHDLPSIFPAGPHWEREHDYMLFIIDELRKEWFAIDNIDVPGSWIATEKSRDDCAKPCEELADKRAEDIAVRVAERYQAAHTRWVEDDAIALRASYISNIDKRDQCWAAIIKRYVRLDMRKQNPLVPIDLQIERNHATNLYY